MKERKEVIRLKNVAKYYEMGDNVVKAVDGIDISIEKGDFVAIMGPSGSGKCLSGETQLILDNGLPIEIRDLEYSDKKVLTLKGTKILPVKMTNFYKRKTKEVYEIITSSGKKIVTTKEHPFFTIREQGYGEIRALDLKKGSFIATPSKLNISGKSQNLNSLSLLSKDDSLYIADSTLLLKTTLRKIKATRKDVCTKLKILPGTYDCWLRKNNISLYNFKRILDLQGKNIRDYEGKIDLTGYCSNHKIKIPLSTNPELLELYGFIAGDGHLDTNGIIITNLDNSIRDRIKYLVKKVFNVPTKESKTKIMINKSVIRSFFVNIFDCPTEKKSYNIKLPDFVFKSKNSEIAGFIRGLFDCDGYVSNSKREMNILLASKALIKQLEVLFLRFGINTRYFKREKYATNTKNKIKRKYYGLSITGYENLSLYQKHIGFNSSMKKNRLRKYVQEGLKDTNINVIPCGSLIREIKRNSSVKLPRKHHKLLWQYEIGKRNPSKRKLKEIIQLFKNNKIPTKKLELLLKQDIFWDKVMEINIIKKETNVYDISVPESENFIANNIIVHNSTTMNLVGSLDLASKGDIYLSDINIEDLEESDLAQIRGQKIGFIFQSFNLIPNLTAKENIILPMLFQGMEKDERNRYADKLLKLVELDERADHYPNQLSGGQQQRVAIARSLANNPDVILADEPTGNLDTKTGERVMKFLEDLNHKGKTIIMVTHDPDLAERHARTVYWIKDGKVEKTTKKLNGKWKIVK